MSLKFLKGPKLGIVSSDTGGDIAITEFTKAVFSYNINITLLMASRCAFALHPLFPNELYQSKLDEFSILAIGEPTAVLVVMLEPEKQILWEYKRKSITKNTLPYIDWGRGVLPDDLENANLILAIGWDKVVQLVEIREALDKEDGYALNGYYESDYEIHSLHWLSESVLLVVNSKKEVVILYTGKFKPGKYPDTQGTSSKERKIEELETPYKIPEELEMQVFSLGKTPEEKMLRSTFHQSIIAKGRQILVLTNAGVHNSKLYTWREYLDEQRDISKWMDALVVSIDLYSGALKGFAEVPEMKDFREATLRAFMKEFLQDGLTLKLDTGLGYASKENEEATKKQIQITIEFCVIISAFDLLFRDIFEIFCERSLENIFLEALEPFILDSKLKSVPIQKDVFNKITTYYVVKGKTAILEKILLNLHVENQDLASLSVLCNTHRLFSAFIYLKTLECNESLFIEPLVMMASEMKNRNLDLDMTTIDDIFKSPAKVEQSAKYIGYKILWYIDLCFKGQRFPPGEGSIIPFESWPRIIYVIINWMTLETNGSREMDLLLKLDLQCVLQVFKGLFENVDTRHFILDPDKYKLKEGFGYKYTDILDKLTASIQAVFPNNAKAMQAFYKFIAKIASYPGILIFPEMCINAAKLLAEATSDSNGEIIDRKQYEELILGLVKNTASLTKPNIESLISTFSLTPYFEVLIFLREKNGDFSKCFETYLNAKDVSVCKKIFQWLIHVREQLDENGEDYKLLKEAIYEKLEKLVIFTL